MNDVDYCARCSQLQTGALHYCHYARAISSEVTASSVQGVSLVTETTTKYEVLGSVSEFVCEQCAKNMRMNLRLLGVPLLIIPWFLIIYIEERYRLSLEAGLMLWLMVSLAVFVVSMYGLFLLGRSARGEAVSRWIQDRHKKRIRKQFNHPLTFWSEKHFNFLREHQP